ncbi:MAG: AEC family transporter [Pseudomonadota bacterium]
MFQQIVNIIFPIFAIVAIGFFYARKHEPDMAAANQINLHIFIPALIFHVLSGKNFHLQEFSNLALAATIIVLGSGLLAWPIAKILKYDIKTFVPPMMFSNSGNMGLPLALFAFGEQALPAAVILFIIENTLHFSVGMKILDFKTAISSILRIPMVLATVAGITFSLTDFILPGMVGISIEMLGQVAIPLMLFSLGVRLTAVDLNDWKIGVIGAIICPLTGIIVLLAMSPFLELPKLQFGLLVIYAVLPPAVLNFMVAEKYKQEPSKVASIVMLGNLASLLFIPIALFYVLN